MTKNIYLEYQEVADKSKRSKRLKLLKKQDFKCGICSKEILGDKNTHWDHDHVTGKFRMFLCNLCNSGLGLFRDDPVLLHKAAFYLERFHAKREVELSI